MAQWPWAGGASGERLAVGTGPLSGRLTALQVLESLQCDTDTETELLWKGPTPHIHWRRAGSGSGALGWQVHCGTCKADLGLI